MDSRLLNICQQHGAFLRREALDLGYHDKEISRLVRAGSWVRIRHGAYVLRELWHGANPMARHLMRSRAAYRTAGTEVVLSHTSSLAVHDTAHWDLPLDAVHLTRRDRRVGRRAAGVSQHCGAVLDEDVKVDGELAYMAGTRTALEITTLTDVERSLVVVNGLLHAQKTTRRLLENRYVDMYQWPRTLTTELVLRLCDGRIESVAESRASYLFFRQGLPRPRVQLAIRDARGVVIARVDFAWPEFGVWVEVDGRIKYDELRRPHEDAVDVLMREKRREELVRELTGWECMRITWADLQHPERTAARIRAAFARARRRRSM
jgi:very-short-patch-repair endonuclease